MILVSVAAVWALAYLLVPAIFVASVWVIAWVLWDAW